MPIYECRNYCGDMKDNHACKVIGHITECPDKCECYTDRFGNQPFKQEDIFSFEDRNI